MDRKRHDEIKEALNRSGLVNYFLLGEFHGTAISTGKRREAKANTVPIPPKHLLIIEHGLDELLPHLSKNSDASEDLKTLLSKLGYVTYRRTYDGRSKKAKRKKT